MLPLRFPNSGIKAKAARRRGVQPRLAPIQDRLAPKARPRPRPLARGWPAAVKVSPQGATAAGSRGGGARRKGVRPLAGRLLVAKSRCHLHRGSGSGGTQGARES
ncbi:hypothetical protein GW17_00052313 [Ensete ventricosum]|nr:hypothetical protein GW17_00052313 [Ensete ventricosum]